MARDPQIELHKQWLGYLQPQGLVVSPIALNEAQAWLSTNVVEPQRRFVELLITVPTSETETAPAIPSIQSLGVDFLGWRKEDLIPGDQTGLEVVLPEYHDTLRPDWAIKDPDPAADAPHPWLLLIRILPHGTAFDTDESLPDDRNWQASWHARFERLLKETGVPIGLLFNGTHLRLVYAPKGESSGHLTFPFHAMAEVAGRPILAGFQLLLDDHRLFTAPRAHRLPALLEKSRKYQNQVSTQLSGQVLEALHALLGGFQTAHANEGEKLLAEWLRTRPDDIYGGLLTVVLRLLFLLYAEDRGLLSNDPAYQGGYSLQGLFERLRQDADRFPDTMDQRFGAWTQLLALFRLVFDGGAHGTFKLPPRHGYLFHPDGGDDAHYQFLEGRPLGEARQVGAVLQPPRISDGVVWRVLQKLMVLDGERISYRTLDVEHLGSVYETMMGFRVEVTKGPSLAIKPQKAHGAPAVVNLLELLDQAPGKRPAWLKENADCKLVGNSAEAIQAAAKPEDVPLALGRKVSPLTPVIVPAGVMVLQPSDARRKSGSHYTPPQLTIPIVETTLRPILEQLGEHPKPERILELKVCDPAMGSGAFLVEACRQLGAELVKAWSRHPATKLAIPPDEDELLYAKRLVATRCLYGVDKNPFAVALAKLSLWLETFAKDHAFTFVDHALRCGDSLVGLSRAQIAAFHWDLGQRGMFVESLLKEKLKEVEELREKIHAADEGTREEVLRGLLRDADDAVADLRLLGDLVVAAFFSEEKDKARRARRDDLAGKVDGWLRAGGGAAAVKEELRREVAELREGERGVVPFHWEVEFPEVFRRERGGFDGFVGNPPFAGKNSILGSNRDGYLDWLKAAHAEAHGNSDLVAHFFRRAFGLLREGGTFGLIATNTIAQGDTRATGLRWICTHGGAIYAASRRTKWPGLAAVVVSVVHVRKGEVAGTCVLDGREAQRITAFLFDGGGDEDPLPLRANAGKSFIGSYVLGMGFTFDDDSDEATPLAEMERLFAADPKNRERVFPYLGGEEVNNSPTHAHRRYVINFGEMSGEEARRGWPDLMAIVEQRVRGRRQLQGSIVNPERWWMFARPATDLYAAVRNMEHVLAISRIGQHGLLTFLPSGIVYSESLVVFALPTYAAFAILQSRIHEAWARFFGSSMKDDLRYTPTDCFETFPFPPNFETDPRLEATGKAYYEFRADLMVRNDEGLTKTYNRFHDPDEQSPGIHRLRELHAAMDRAVLDAHGWTNLQPTHDFLLDYEEEDDDEEDNGRTRKRKKPWRYRWPDDFRDEVLARLLKLNQERAADEALHTPTAKPSAGSGKRNRTRKGDVTPNLFGSRHDT